MNTKITFIGFGEAVQNIVQDIEKNESLSITAYARSLSDSARGGVLKAAAQEYCISITDNLEQAVAESQYIVSLVNGKTAYEVGQQVIPFLNTQQLYVDLNSTLPKVAEDLAKIALQHGVPFADGAIMGPVPKFKSKVPIVVCGSNIDGFVSDMNRVGLCVSAVGNKIGGASAMKLIRSIFQKSFPQVMMEFMLTAEKYGVLEQIIDSLDKTLANGGLRAMATLTFTPTVIHAKRRTEEAFEAARMIDESGELSLMTEAAAKRLQALSSLGFTKEDFETDFDPYDKIIRMILQRKETL